MSFEETPSIDLTENVNQLETDDEEEMAEQMEKKSEEPKIDIYQILANQRKKETDQMTSTLKELENFIGEVFEEFEENHLTYLNYLTDKLRAEMDKLTAFCDNSKLNLENIRSPIKFITTTITKKLAASGKECCKASAEACQLDVQQKKLNQQLANLNDELLRASKFTAETELASLEAQKACKEAIAIADHLREEMEEKRRLAAEQARLLELSKQQELERLLEEERRREEEERLEEMQMLARQEEAYLWPTFPLLLNSLAEFDGGIGCLIKADPVLLQQGEIQCEYIKIMNACYEFYDDEELISHVVRIFIKDFKCNDGAIMLKPGMCLSIPHCMPRHQNHLRETVIKMQQHKCLEWKELKTAEKTFERFKDIRFAQAQTNFLGTFLVVSRNKKSVTRIKRAGGNGVSKIDPKITFSIPPGALIKPEKVVLQLQPLDNQNLKHLKKTLAMANNLITASSIVKISWVNKSFETPIQMTVILPPNPIVLKKLIKNKSKEDESGAGNKKHMNFAENALRMDAKNLIQAKPESSPNAAAPNDHEEEDSNLPLNKPINWYMGIYDLETEDESDNVFLVRKVKEKWVVENVKIENTAMLDVVKITMPKPFEKFVILRTTVNLNSKGAETIASSLDEIMSQKIVSFVVFQHKEYHNDFVASVAPIQKVDKVIALIEEKNYNAIYNKEQHFMLKEGEKVKITFRGNLKYTDEIANLSSLFNVNFDCNISLSLKEHDIFVQKCYDVYRGFVQLNKLLEEPPQINDSKNLTAENLTESVSHLGNELLKMVSEHMVTLPKNQNLLALKVMNRAVIQYIDDDCEIKLINLFRLAMELGNEWIEFGKILGIPFVILHTIENNAILEKRTDFEKKIEMLNNWIKTQSRSANKKIILTQALLKVKRPDLIQYLENSLEELTVNPKSAKSDNRVSTFYAS